LDRITEEFCRGMDAPHKREPQRMIGLARLLGECYNYAMINSTIIFDFLYYFLHYGHEVPPALPRAAAATSPAVEALLAALALRAKAAAGPPQGPPGDGAATGAVGAGAAAGGRGGQGQAGPVPVPKLASDVLRQFHNVYHPTAPSDIDSPVDLFRAQLVVEVLRSCGSYFVRGILRDRLSRFLLHFQRYLLCKAYIPLHIEFAILELFDELEALAAAAALKDAAKSSRRPAKGQGGRAAALAAAAALPNLHTMALIFPRFDAYHAVQEEITLRYGEDESSESEGEESEEEEERAEGKHRAGGEDGEEAAGAEEEEGAVPEEGEDDAALSEANAATLMAKLRQQEEEDDDFERAFRSAMLESVSSAQRGGGEGPSAGSGSGGGGGLAAAGAGGSRAISGVDRMERPAVLPKPRNVFQPKVYSREGYDDEDSGSEEDLDEADAGPGQGAGGHAPVVPQVKFKLLSRDQKGRFETREFSVNEDALMVTRLERANEQQRLEKQRLKETVLRYEKQNLTGGSGAAPVAYLGGKDHFSAGRPNQTQLTSTRYQKQSSNESSSDSAAAAAAPMAARTLNLDAFLNVSGQAEVRKFNSSVNRNPPQGNR
jgi:hypothetical protein